MVPFGYEIREREKEIDNEVPEPQYERVYIDVTAIRTHDGKLIPISFIWDSIEYKISKVLSSQFGHSLKHKISAQSFLCMCRNLKFHLFFEDGGFGNQRFYIELKDSITIG